MERRSLLVVGHGMVGHRLVTSLGDAGGLESWNVTVAGEEPHLAYDRIALSRLFTGVPAASLSLTEPGIPDDPRVRVLTGHRVIAIDRAGHTATTVDGTVLPWDVLVLATGSVPFVPPIDGREATGCFVYRTISDVEAIRAHAATCRDAAVIGGGLLGLEAAGGLVSLGLATTVVEFAPRLMPVQLDPEGGAALRRQIEALGVTVRLDACVSQVRVDSSGRARSLAFEDGNELTCQTVVFSAGIRPRDDLARAAALEVHDRGGVVVDDACRTSDPDIFAVGECAVAAGRVWGLVGPGYQMAEVVVNRLLGGTKSFTGADTSTKLKLLGVDVASVGDSQGQGKGCESVVYRDELAGVYRRVVLGPPDGGRRPVVGGVLVGDVSGYATLRALAGGDAAVPEDPVALVLPAGISPAATDATSLGDDALVCSCNGVTRATISAAIREQELSDVAAVKACTRAGTGCGACVPVIAELLAHELAAAGISAKRRLCEHFELSRRELFDIVRVRGIRSFEELLLEHGQGLGCDICKPAVASMLASTGNGYILDGEQAGLQDTNDHFLANLQRDGSYSVVPRVPGGEITPDQLIAIGEVAKDFGLYTKITGGQRIDLFGARVEQLPEIWARLIEAGLESGHAYGKAVRTVKSCVGSTWCRYGVQDSTSLAIELELRYRGLRAPHKVKLAVSGCARECAEAQSKDVGVIATERGWNLYVAGNGGLRPRHADLLAVDLDRSTLIRYIDRFLMYYVHTADRLERTATWLTNLDGGIDHVKRVVIEDSLGLAAELEAAMAAHVASYRCEWAETLADPLRRARFRSFVNSSRGDPDLVYVPLRGQHRPARPDERPVTLP